MSRGKAHSKPRFGIDRLFAIWAAGLLSAFAVGLYAFAPKETPQAPEPVADTALPAEIAVSDSARPAPKREAPAGN